MDEKRISCELHTDYDIEVNNLPAHAWAEAVFSTPEDEIVVEVNAADDPIISVSVGPHVTWKGSVTDFKLLLRGLAQ
ncbi:hypothetical protein ACI3L3_15425 [Desulfobaculum sp. SPO524]|uniref:hypothetical protein n=1 Tax=Desulfobaculum sp. SPO524 TaxID=3378071 RepID=UPI00385226DB